MKRSLVFASWCLAAGCSSLQTIEPNPVSEAPEQFVNQGVLESMHATGRSEADSVVDVRWWEGFRDPTLNDLVERGLNGNFDIAVAAANVQQAQANLDLTNTRDDLLAELNASATSRNNNRDGNGSTVAGGRNDQNNTVLLGLSVVLPVDLAGRNAFEVQASTLNLMAVQADLRGRLIGVSTDIAQEYLRLRGNQKQMSMLKDSLALQQETLRIVQVRFESGLAPELDVRRAETAVENLRARVPLLAQSQQASVNRLATLTGQFPASLSTLLDQPAALPVYDASIPNRLPLRVLQTRPDVQSAQARLLQAAAQLGVAQANFYPSLNLMANLQFGSALGGSNPAASMFLSSLSAMLNQVIYDGGAKNAEREIARAQMQARLADYEQVLRVAVQEVEDTLFNLGSSLERQAALGSAVKSSRRSFQQADSLYQLGLVSFLDVVDAQRVSAEAEQALAAEQTNHAILVARLFRALGIQAGTQPVVD